MNAADDSDLTPALPPPSYAYSLTIPVHRPAGEPPPARPMSPPNPSPDEAPPPGYQPPTAASSFSNEASSQPPQPTPAPRSPPPVFSVVSLPCLLEAAPSGASLGDDDDESPPTEQQRLWDLWSARGVGLGERVVRMRAFQAGVLIRDDEDEADRLRSAPTGPSEPTAPAIAAATAPPPVPGLSSFAARVADAAPPVRARPDPRPPGGNAASLPEAASTGVEALPRTQGQPPADAAQANPSRIPRPVRTPVRVEVPGRPPSTAGRFPGAGRSLRSPSSPTVERPAGSSHNSDSQHPSPSARP